MSILRTASRSFRRDPWFAVTAIVVLAVAAGACTTVFSALEAVLLSPLPFRDPGRLVLVWATHPTRAHVQTSMGDFKDWRARNQVFEDMAATSHPSWNLIGYGDAERLSGQAVTPNFFTLLGARMALGRPFAAEDATGAVPRVAILSYSLWQSKFGSNPGVLGSKITLNQIPLTIVGVASPDMLFPEATDIWTPIPSSEHDYGRRNELLQVVARLKPGVSVRQAEAGMKTVAKALESEYPKTNTNWSVALTPLDKYIAGDVGFATMILFGAVMLVLLIACGNVANLLLARASTRRTEIAVRMALGASRPQLIREFLIESACVSIPAVALGLLIAAAGARGIAALPIPHAVRLHDTSLNLAVFGCAALMAVLTTLFFGFVPFTTANKIDIQKSLKESGRASTGSARHSLLRRTLIVGEFALSVVLLAGAGLLIRTFVNLQNVDLGFRPSNVLSMRIIRFSDDSTVFIRALLGLQQRLPGVKSAGVSISVPLSGRNDITDFRIEGRPAPPPGVLWNAGLRAASPGYFETMGIPLLKGRLFTEDDDETAGHERVAIINEAMARRFFPDIDPIGQRVTLGGLRRIVGVVGNVRHVAFEAPAEPELYAPYTLGTKVLTIAVRTESDPRSFIGAIRSQIAILDRNQPVFSIKTMDQLVAETLATRRYAMALVTGFAAFALLLAVVGVYSVTAYSVAQRTAEIGIRMALGADGSDIRRMVVSESSRLIGVGISMGLIAALGLTRLLGSLLYGVTPADPAVLIATIAVLAGLGVVAALRPAIRAGNVDPVSAMRQL